MSSAKYSTYCQPVVRVHFGWEGGRLRPYSSSVMLTARLLFLCLSRTSQSDGQQMEVLLRVQGKGQIHSPFLQASALQLQSLLTDNESFAQKETTYLNKPHSDCLCLIIYQENWTNQSSSADTEASRIKMHRHTKTLCKLPCKIEVGSCKTLNTEKNKSINNQNTDKGCAWLGEKKLGCKKSKFLWSLSFPSDIKMWACVCVPRTTRSRGPRNSSTWGKHAKGL